MECIFINSISEISEDVIEKACLPVFYSNEKYCNFENSFLIDIKEDRKKEINFDVFNSVIYWGVKKVNEISINDILSLDGFHFWHYNKFRLYFRIRNIFYEIELLKKLKNKGYTNFIVYSDYNYEIEKYVKGIKVSKVKFEKRRSLKKYISLLKYSFVFLFRALSDLCKNGKNVKHFIVDNSIKQPCVKHNGKVEKDNYALGYLFDKLNDDFVILNELVPPKLTEKFKIEKSFLFSKNRRNRTIRTDTILLKGLISLRVRRRYREIIRKIKDKLNYLKINLNTDIDRLIIESLIMFMDSNEMYLLKYLSFQKFFKSSNCISVTATDENGPIARSILDAAKSESKIKIGIQHGAIHGLHPNYVFSRDEQIYLPDFTFVWGKKWFDLLKDIGNFADESLIVTGQIRTDIIPFLTKQIKYEVFTVVYASQPQRDSVLRERTAFEIMKAIKQLPDCKLVIKPHPSEKNADRYFSILAKKIGLSNMEVLDQAELYLTLSQCDLVITSFSTVGTEAIYFNKPLIIYDPLLQDIQNYHKEGVALQAVDSDDIRRFINGFKEKTLEINKSAYNQFIENNAFKIDGKAVDRCLEFFKSL